MLTATTLAEACRRVSDFAAVNQPSTNRETAAEVAWWLLGFTDDLKIQLLEWMDEVGITPESQGAVLLGLTIALFAYDAFTE